MNFITTRDNTKLYVKDWGTGRPVIFIHGWPLSSDSWDDQMMVVAQAGYRAIAYDRRGFGRSSQPWGGYDYNTFADDLADVMEATKAHDATLVGFSMGGGEVARYMSRYQGLNVVQAVLIASVVPYLLKTPDHPEGIDQSAFDERIVGLKKDRAHMLTDFYKIFYGVGLISQPVSDEVLQWSRSVSMQASLKATIDCVRAFSSTDFRPDLAAFSVPTLLIHGTEDKNVPIDITSRATAKAIRNAKLIEYDGAAHGVLVTHKEQVANDLLAFLAR